MIRRLCMRGSVLLFGAAIVLCCVNHHRADAARIGHKTCRVCEPAQVVTEVPPCQPVKLAPPVPPCKPVAVCQPVATCHSAPKHRGRHYVAYRRHVRGRFHHGRYVTYRTVPSEPSPGAASPEADPLPAPPLAPPKTPAPSVGEKT